MHFSDPSEYPRITIITPSHNQGHFIEETIQSVLSQGYPNLEYIIIDGGSTDQTIEIIERYAAQITYWVSEPDHGQADALNKGLARATGDILAYINSDDYYLPETFFRVAEHFCQFPQTDLLHGRCLIVDESSRKIGEHFGNVSRVDEILDLWDVWWAGHQLIQPEVFWSRSILERIGPFRENLYYVMDYEYWCRIIICGGVVRKVDEAFSCFRRTSQQKTANKEAVAQELLTTVQSILWDKETPLQQCKRLELQGKWAYHVRFLNQVEVSTHEKQSRAMRWFQSIKVIWKYPQVLLASRFRQRVEKNALMLIGLHR